tara:strand:+ start:1436 stop:2416 length:981 start_codon:yes stop_codon:yes gene_type:complete
MEIFKTKLSLLSFIIFINSYGQVNNDVTIYKNSALSLVDQDSKIEILGDSFVVAEGPLWDAENNQLIFSDVRQNKLFSWDENNGINEYIVPSGSTGYAPSFKDGGIGANGITFNKKGQIVLCQHGDRRLAFVSNIKDNNAQFTTIIDNYNGKRFNSPNDLAISKNGDIYFTDPPYGFKNFNNKFRELDFNGVYKYSVDGRIKLITKEMTRPNGIALSIDEKYIYVNNSDRDDPKIMRFNSKSFKGKVFFDGTKLVKNFKGGFDGLKIHSSGNIFTTGPNGILILSPKGSLLATINYGKAITNCNFDTNEEYLYVTGFNDVSRIKLK